MYPELTDHEKSSIKYKMKSKIKEDSLDKLDKQIWDNIKNGNYQLADKCAKIFWYIKEL
jgi:hypothetical protein